MPQRPKVAGAASQSVTNLPSQGASTPVFPAPKGHQGPSNGSVELYADQAGTLDHRLPPRRLEGDEPIELGHAHALREQAIASQPLLDLRICQVGHDGAVELLGDVDGKLRRRRDREPG